MLAKALSFEDVRVGVEDLDAVDGGLGFEEVGHLGGWWEVVGDGSIVDADGVSGGGVAQREQEEKEKWDKLGL